MKAPSIASVLLTCLVLLVLATAGCEKSRDDLPDMPSTDPASTPSSSANLAGTWIARSAIIDGQPASVDAVYEEGYHPKSDSFILQFTSNGEYSYLFLDSDGTTLWHLQGPVQLAGSHLSLPITSCYGQPNATGFKIFDGTWSLNRNELVLTTYYPQPDGKPHASVIYIKQ